MTSSVNFMLTSELTTAPKVLSINVGVARALQQKPAIFKESTNRARVGFDQAHQSSLPRSNFVVHTRTIPIPRSPPHSLKDPKNAERRLRRYSHAEEALSSSLRRCSTQSSPQELQIRTLERATSILSAHAEEARERAAQLRQALTTQDIDPEIHKDLKRQRWLEERRQQQADAESRAMNGVLVSLRQQTPPSTQETRPTPPTDTEARRRANLSKFFASSGKRASLPPHRASLPVERRTKRMTMADVSPMKLRSSFPFPTSDSTQFTHTHLRSKSLDTSSAAEKDVQINHHPRSRISALPAAAVAQTPPLSAVTEDPSVEEQEQAEDEEPSSTSDDLSVAVEPALASTTSAGVSVTEANSTRCPTPPAAPEHMLLPHIIDHSSFSGMDGTAIIYVPEERTDEEVFSKLGEFEVLIPQYARDLINKFGAEPPQPTPPRQPNVAIATPTPTPSSRFKRKSASSLRPRASFFSGGSSEEGTTASTSPRPKKPTSRRQLHSLFSDGITARLGLEASSKSNPSSPTTPPPLAARATTQTLTPPSSNDRRRSRSLSPSARHGGNSPNANLATRWKKRISQLRPH